EQAAIVRWLIFDSAIIGFTQFACNIESQPCSTRLGGKKRFKQMRDDAFGNAGAVILDGNRQFGFSWRFDQGKCQATLLPAAMVPAVATDIPENLIQVVAVKQDASIMSSQIHPEVFRGDF